MTRQTKINTLLAQYNLSTEKELQEFLKKKYYSEVPVITDVEYDELFGDKDYVGYTPDENGPWQVLPHKIAMGSLSKLKTWQQALDWLKDKDTVIWEPKLDGLSIELVYESGTLKHAILRGGGDKGEDILKNAEKFAGVPKYLMLAPDYVSVRGEVIISKTNFELLNKDSEGAYANRRNCISGICRRYDGKYAGLLGFYAYDIIEQINDVNKEYSSESEKLVTLYNFGFRVPFAYNTMSEEQYSSYGDIRDTAEEFQMDGLVIKTSDMQHQIALKFEPKGELTTVTGYTWEVGTTGKLVPTIWFEPVEVGGTKLTKAAIGSYQGYVDLCATVGSKVEVRKMGDVIPKVTKVIEQNKAATMETPEVCPICGSTLERKGTDLYCTNEDCTLKVENKCCAVYWAVAIKGFKDGFIRKLIEKGRIRKCYEVPKITPEDIVELGGTSLDRANKIIKQLKQSYSEVIRDNNVEHLLWMLPIPSISGKAYSKLASCFKDIRDLEIFLTDTLNSEDLVSALGNAKGSAVYEYFVRNKQDILKLIWTLREI